MGSLLAVFAMGQFQNAPKVHSNMLMPSISTSNDTRQHPQPSENATIIPELGTTEFPFDFSLEANQVTVSRGQVNAVTVTIQSSQKINVSLSIDTTALGQSQSLNGIKAWFDQTDISVEAGSRAAVTLRLSIEDQATLGNYQLGVVVALRTKHAEIGISKPLMLIIPQH